MRSRKGCRSSARVSFGSIFATSTAAIGFCTLPTIVISPIWRTIPALAWSDAAPAPPRHRPGQATRPRGALRPGRTERPLSSSRAPAPVCTSHASTLPRLGRCVALLDGVTAGRRGRRSGRRRRLVLQLELALLAFGGVEQLVDVVALTLGRLRATHRLVAFESRIARVNWSSWPLTPGTDEENKYKSPRS